MKLGNASGRANLWLCCQIDGVNLSFVTGGIGLGPASGGMWLCFETSGVKLSILIGAEPILGSTNVLLFLTLFLRPYLASNILMVASNLPLNFVSNFSTCSNSRIHVLHI